MRKLIIPAALAAITLACIAPRTMGQVGSSNKDYYDRAKDYFKSEKATDRAFALSTYGMLKEFAKPASREIVGGLFDTDKAVRQAATLALPDVNPTIARPVLTLVNREAEYEDRQAA